jgi:hypothetical protein
VAGDSDVSARVRAGHPFDQADRTVERQINHPLETGLGDLPDREDPSGIPRFFRRLSSRP